MVESRDAQQPRPCKPPIAQALRQTRPSSRSNEPRHIRQIRKISKKPDYQNNRYSLPTYPTDITRMTAPLRPHWRTREGCGTVGMTRLGRDFLMRVQQWLATL